MKTLLLALALVATLTLAGCFGEKPLGATYPYAGELVDNDGNPVNPPSWTNNPATNGATYESTLNE
jgi:hypothetical protein